MRLVVLVVTLATAIAPASAQSVQTGTLTGTVVDDRQQAPLADVTVTVTSPALQGTRTATTDAEGTFVLPLLPPGAYDVRFDRAQLATVRTQVAVPLGGASRIAVQMGLKPIEARVDVTVTPTPLVTPASGLNVRRPDVEALPIDRDVPAIARLSTGVADTAPDAAFGQLAINGAFAYDNLFVVNGVEINDAVVGTPQRLYIEDAIEETFTLTSGIPAEYGRFTGGVIGAITRSGGDRFSGSLRLNLTNPAWSDETPIEESIGATRDSVVNESWEATLGGPVLRQRLWFFAAGRTGTVDSSGTLPFTHSPYARADRNRRGEAKITATPRNGHTVLATFAGDQLRETNRPATSQSIDLASLVTPTQWNWYAVGTYRAALDARTLTEVTYAERRFSFEDFGGLSRDITQSPFVFLDAQTFYNAPPFDGTVAEERNNRQGSATVTRFLEAGGSHQMRGGYELFRTTRSGGSFPNSSTGRLFVTPYESEPDGQPRLTAGRVAPVFLPFASAMLEVVGTPGARFDTTTHSAFAQDRWALGPRLSTDLGVRFERFTSEDRPSGRRGVAAHVWMPRLAASYDVSGTGSQVAQVSYGWYAGRFPDAQIGANAAAIHNSYHVRPFLGSTNPEPSPADGFDIGNYGPVVAVQSPDHVVLDPDLRAPLVREVTLSYGVRAGGSGYLEATYVGRRAAHLVDDVIDTANGIAVTAVAEGPDVETTRVLWTNVDRARRVYDALQLQGRGRIVPRLTVNGQYTLQLRNEGNYVGEASGFPGMPSAIGDYPEAFTEARHYPDGRLPGFQRHRLRVWGLYDADLGAAGRMSLGGLWRVESGQAYSLTAVLPYSDIQTAALLAAGYPPGEVLDPFRRQVVYFGERGAETFPAYGLFDLSVNYALPIARTLAPFVKVDLFNVLNNRKVIAYNTIVESEPSAPTDALGLPAQYMEPTREPVGPASYPGPGVGTTGGFTMRLAFGMRF